MVLRKSGQLHAIMLCSGENLPQAPDKGHDGISARYRVLGVDRHHVKIAANLRWCFSTVTNSATVVWSTPMFLHFRSAVAQMDRRDDLTH
jgi:hypothetical protein